MSLELSKYQNEFRLQTELCLPRKVEEIFPFFAEAKNLETLTPSFLSFHLTSDREVEMAVGTIINYRLRIRGLPIKWRSLISVWEPPFQFVDEQLRGRIDTGFINILSRRKTGKP